MDFLTRMELKKEKTKGVSVLVMILLSGFFLLLVQIGVAQPLVITGEILAGEDERLPSATVQLMTFDDSTVVANGVTDIYGIFVLTDSLPKARYIFKASYIGFRPAYKDVIVEGNDTVSIGILRLRERAIQLEEVTITERRDPIVMKDDTIEYRVESFSTMPHANVETLLRKIPGLEVGRDGSINAGGAPVVRIYVNGKEVFGDLQLITKNLPADAIDKVQVIDDLTEGDRFSLMKSTSTSRAINIQLKPEYQRTRFGSMTGGAGDDERYAAEGKFNHFNKGNQITAIVRSNNINNVDMYAFGTPNALEKVEGLQTSHSGAINVLKNLSDNFSIYGSYQGVFSENIFDTYLARQTFLSEGVASFSDWNQQTTKALGPQAVGGIQYADSMNSLRMAVSGNLADVTSAGKSIRESESPDLEGGYTGERDYAIKNMNLGGNALFFYGHRFKRPGRSINIDANYSLNKNSLEDESNNNTHFRNGSVENANQLNDQRNKNYGYSGKVSYTEPLGRRQQIKVFYALSDRASESQINVFDLSEGWQKLDAERSNEINSDFRYQQAGITYQFKGKHFTFSAGSELQQSELSRKSLEENVRFDQTFQSILPQSRIEINLSDNARLNIRYNTAVREPSVNELQPLESWTDPLNVYLPNLNLRPEYVHQGHVNFNLSSTKSFFLSATATGTYIDNPITQAVTIDEQQRRSTQYINTGKSHAAAGNVHVTVPLVKLKSNLKVGSFARYQSSVNFINAVESTQNQMSYGGEIAYAYAYNGVFDLSLSGYYNITSLENHIMSPASQIIGEGFNGVLGILALKRIRIGSTFSYRRLQNTAVDFDEYFPMMDLALGIFLFKNKAAELSLSGNNVLNQSKSGVQRVGVNFIEQRINQTILGRFYLIRFTYHFKFPTN